MGSGLNTSSFLLSHYVFYAFRSCGVVNAVDSNVSVAGARNLVVAIRYLGFLNMFFVLLDHSGSFLALVYVVSLL